MTRREAIGMLGALNVSAMGAGLGAANDDVVDGLVCDPHQGAATVEAIKAEGRHTFTGLTELTVEHAGGLRRCRSSARSCSRRTIHRAWTVDVLRVAKASSSSEA
jgi:hypothetical protein